MNERNFKIMLVASLVLGLCSVAVDLFPGVLPPSFIQAQETHDSQLPYYAQLLEIAAGLVLFVISVSALAGLFHFRWWARRQAVVATAIGFAWSMFFGASAQSGLALALGEVSSSLWGAVLAVAYFSPIAARFKRSDA